MIQLEILNKEPVYDVKQAACTTIGKKASKTKKLSKKEELEFWCEQMLQEHSILRAVTFRIFDDDMRGDICSQLLRATKGHPQPEVQSSRPDWNKGAPRKPSNETFIMFTHLHTAESWMALCRQRLCFSTMPETRDKVLDVLVEMATSEEPFFQALALMCVPQCVYRMGCCDRKNCGYLERIIKAYDTDKDKDIFDYKEFTYLPIIERYKYFQSTWLKQLG